MSNFFKTRRDELKCTQRSLAIAIGVTDRTIANWESGEIPELKNVPAMALAYQVSESRIEKAVLDASRARRELAMSAK